MADGAQVAEEGAPVLIHKLKVRPPFEIEIDPAMGILAGDPESQGIGRGLEIEAGFASRLSGGIERPRDPGTAKPAGFIMMLTAVAHAIEGEQRAVGQSGL